MENTQTKTIKILDLAPGIVKGINVQMPGINPPNREAYFEWSESSLNVKFLTNEVSGGVLQTWKHVPVYREIETHIDAETFYFNSGVALMLFMDFYQGQPNLDTAQVVRIQPGTQLIIPAGKGHFVPVAEGDAPLHIVVVSPKMEALRVPLPVEIEGVL